MLQYPTNFNPQNVSVDPSINPYITFTFNGDMLLTTWLKIWDLHSGQFIVSSPPLNVQINQKVWYNGETAQHRIPNEAIYGRDYVVQLMLMQGTVDNDTFDMYVLSGMLQEDTVQGRNNFYIEKNISSIYEWNEVDGERLPLIVDKVDLQLQVIGTKVVCGMVIEIESERHLISSYNPTTGKIVVDEDFSFDVSAGTQYKIYKNYLITPQYSFSCRQNPTSEILNIGRSLSNDRLSYRVVAEYNQEQGDLIKRYNIKLYNKAYESDPYPTFITESGDVYSQKVDYRFYDFFYWHGVPNTQTYMYVECEIESNTGQITTCTETAINDIDYEYDAGFDYFRLYEHDDVCAPSYVSVELEDKQYVDLSWRYADTEHRIKYVEVYRKKGMNRLETEWEFLDYRVNMGGNDEFTGGYNDYAVQNRGEATYMIVPYLDAGGTYICSQGIKTETIDVNMDGYSISGLVRRDASRNKKKVFTVDEQWKFLGDIANTTETQNINKPMHLGYAKYPLFSDTPSDYITGKFTGLLGYPDCSNGRTEYVDDATMARKWREFVRKYEMYLLKTAKGGVYLVTISGSEISCEENITPLPLTVSFDWTECASFKDVMISNWW